MNPNTLFQSFRNGDVTANEFAVGIAAQAMAKGLKTVTASTTQIANTLNGLSRHAVARALRSLEDAGYICWNTQGTSRTSTITFS